MHSWITGPCKLATPGPRRTRTPGPRSLSLLLDHEELEVAEVVVHAAEEGVERYQSEPYRDMDREIDEIPTGTV